MARKEGDEDCEKRPVPHLLKENGEGEGNEEGRKAKQNKEADSSEGDVWYVVEREEGIVV